MIRRLPRLHLYLLEAAKKAFLLQMAFAESIQGGFEFSLPPASARQFSQIHKTTHSTVIIVWLLGLNQLGHLVPDFLLPPGELIKVFGAGSRVLTLLAGTFRGCMLGHRTGSL